MKKTIAFIMPGGHNPVPIGGHKVVYEYADRFAKDDYDVHIIFPQYVKLLSWNFRESFYRKLRASLIFLMRKILKLLLHKECTGTQNWFHFKNKVNLDYLLQFKNSKIINNNNAVFIATGIASAYVLNEEKRINDTDKYYFIQGFESWGNFTEQNVFETYKFPFTKITIAPWLADCIESVGQTSHIIENGLDFDYFKISNTIGSRNPYEVAMLYHESEVKRTCDAIDALKIVKEKVPELHVTMFGVSARPNVPNWFSYYQTPNKENHNAIYNNAAIFVAPSRLEGMGLTPAEAMICGCAVACTDNPGFAIFAKHNQTALISTAMDVQALADNILMLIQDNDLRFRIAKGGHDFIKRFTWESSYKKFKEVLDL